jgi:hexosaminidase
MSVMNALCRTILLLVLPANMLHSQPAPSIIPLPVSLKTGSGYFTLDASTAIRYDTKAVGLKPVADWFLDAIRDLSGTRPDVNPKSGKLLELLVDRTYAGGEEGYRLQVTPTSVRITARSKAGIFYGLTTLLQTLPAVRTNAPLQVPCMEISDEPRFRWRGLHLDVSRHFFSTDVIRRYIDLMATYKLNRFHWHLTDDQGWRLEVKKYPNLTATGAWRVDHTDKPWGARPQAKPGEPATYGGYYTQEQVREIVAYAATRNVTVVPEIEMPGHAAAAIAAYPQMGCTGKAQLPLTGGDYAGISSSFCAGNDEVFRILEDVLSEVIAIFPSAYIHIGGDEVDKGPWKKCSRCQARMKNESLKNEEELQSWFIRRIEKFVVSKGRKIIGWDEILEGGLAPSATVMSWRGEAGGIAAAKMDHDVVMTPGNPCYFDHYQAGPEGEPRAIGGMNTLQKVYAYEPVPADLKGERSRFVLGAQANVWTEYITTPEHLEYMILPRMPALAEVLWTPAGKRDWADFNRRLKPHTRAFEQKGIRYSKGNFKVDIRPETVGGALQATLSTEAVGGEIRYTLDGSEPTVTAQRYEKPVPIASSSVLRAVTVVDGEVMGARPAEQSFTFNKATGSKVSYLNPPARQYMASGNNALADGVRGVHAVGSFWHGFNGTDLVATLDMGTSKKISRLALGCLQRYNDWIFMPAWVRFEVSADGISFKEAGIVQNTVSPTDRTSTIRDFGLAIPLQEIRYIRVTAGAIASCPKGHPGEGSPGWIFADEIIAE